MHRIQEGDILVLKKGHPCGENKWEVIKIPAWVDEDTSKLLKLPVGSSYFPEWKSKEVLKNDEEEIKAIKSLMEGNIAIA